MDMDRYALLWELWLVDFPESSRRSTKRYLCGQNGLFPCILFLRRFAYSARRIRQFPCHRPRRPFASRQFQAPAIRCRATNLPRSCDRTGRAFSEATCFRYRRCFASRMRCSASASTLRLSARGLGRKDRCRSNLRKTCRSNRDTEWADFVLSWHPYARENAAGQAQEQGFAVEYFLLMYNRVIELGTQRTL